MRTNWELVATVWDDELKKPVDITLSTLSANTTYVPWDVFTLEMRSAHLHLVTGPKLTPRFVDGWVFPKFVVYRTSRDGESLRNVIVESRYP